MGCRPPTEEYKSLPKKNSFKPSIASVYQFAGQALIPPFFFLGSSPQFDLVDPDQAIDFVVSLFNSTRSIR
jgi:hypothetical protein